jgi:hypothetical protein
LGCTRTHGLGSFCYSRGACNPTYEKWKNRIPVEIVRLGERHGFIWGGYWLHYDTMDFEYRPELLAERQAARPQ